MRFARLGTTLIAGALVVGLALPAEAATTTISIVSRTQGFNPTTVSGAEGTTFAWNNTDSIQHTSTQDSPLALWNTSTINAGATKSVTVASAGAYPYHCAIHPTMTGTVKVPIKVGPATGTAATTFTITMATTAATGNFVYDVQERIGTGAWMTFKTGLTAKSTTFKATATGSYSFRSRLRDKTVAGKSSGWSPKKSISVT
ncbi:MAG TPA: cupredoxin domain-containing protein [Actinomycetota bacterium]